METVVSLENLAKLAVRIRGQILISTSRAGSGHPSSSLSAVELMVVLAFAGILKKPDHLIFSKGHAAPLLYALAVAKGLIDESELLTLRKFNSRLEGHPTLAFPWTEVATGSLGQGLSVGTGMAMAAKYLSHSPEHTYVLLGDGEMMEGANWEAATIAAHYQLSNLTAIVDVSRLEQTGESEAGWHLNVFRQKFQAFGWEWVIVRNGHDFSEISKAYQTKTNNRPRAIIAQTIKGKGVSFLENKPGWHGKVLSNQQLQVALQELKYA